jgi:hypothetical protein
MKITKIKIQPQNCNKVGPLLPISMKKVEQPPGYSQVQNKKN